MFCKREEGASKMFIGLILSFPLFVAINILLKLMRSYLEKRGGMASESYEMLSHRKQMYFFLDGP